MIYVIYTVHILVCIFLILVVLLQQGKGADLSVFGGGSTQTAFGARGATTLLHKLTVASFVIFILTTLAIGIPQFAGESSVMSGAAAAGKPTPGVPAKPGAAKAAPAPIKPGTKAAAPAAPAGVPAKPGAPAKPAGAPPAPQR